MSECQTVKVKHGDGFMTINAADFDSAVHEKYEETDAKPSPKVGVKVESGEPVKWTGSGATETFADAPKPDKSGGKKTKRPRVE